MICNDHPQWAWLENLLAENQWRFVPSPAKNEIYIEVLREDWIRLALLLTERGPAYLATMFANDERSLSGGFAVYAVFSVQNQDLFIGIRFTVPESDPRFPSLTPHIPAAHWYEREIKDLYGVIPVGHPDPRRLVLHRDWPDEVYPMRKDFIPGTPVKRESGDLSLLHVEGEGVFEVPVGPIHAGIIEPGHFRFSVVGENVLHLEARLFYTHRGIEKMCEGLDVYKVLHVAERICGACSLSHATAYAQAVERIANVDIPSRARTIRTIGLELERLYNHVGDIGNICAGVGFAFGNMQFAKMKEELMSLNERFIGNRFLHGVIALGGVQRDLTKTMAADITHTLTALGSEFAQVSELLLDHDEFMDRVENTGILSTVAAGDLGVVGPVARTSGLDRDWRRDHPYADYPHKIIHIPYYESGDVLARIKVRIGEVIASLRIINECLEGMDPGAVCHSIGPLPPHQWALGYVESPRGADVHWVMTGENNTVYRYMIRSASYTNWPSVAMAVPGNIVPDFPLINKSYELCYACLDR